MNIMNLGDIKHVVQELKAKVDNLPPSNNVKEKGDLYGSYFDKVGRLLKETKIRTPDSSHKEYLSVYQGWAKSAKEISKREEKKDTSGLALYEEYFNELARELETVANTAISGAIGGPAGHIIPKSVIDKGMAQETVNVAEMSQSVSLKDLIPANSMVITKEKVEEIKKLKNLSTEQLLKELIPIAKTMAKPFISKYYVGAAGVGKSGNIYLGVNLEFPGFSLNQTVHGEQFVTANAKNNGEEELTDIAVSAAPCGHCRQFLNEIGNGEKLSVIIPDKQPTPLAHFLPDSFGPKDLGVEGALLSPRDNKLQLISPLEENNPDKLQINEALKAANIAYAPYSNSPSGAAIKTTNGEIFRGSYLENAAFNPSLSPLQSALITMIAHGHDYPDIEKVILVEKQNANAEQTLSTSSLLKNIAPNASCAVYNVK